MTTLILVSFAKLEVFLKIFIFYKKYKNWNTYSALNLTWTICPSRLFGKLSLKELINYYKAKRSRYTVS